METLTWIAGAIILLVLIESSPKWGGWLLLFLALYYLTKAKV